MNDVIDQTQSALLGDRYLLHSVVVANEVIEKAKRKKKTCLVFKIDYEKAYDSICWFFLIYMIQKLGFDEKSITWIWGCLTSSMVSMLMNGSPTKEFALEMGLRQGDPLTPFLFTLVVEGLSGMMRKVIAENLYQGFLVWKIALKWIRYNI